MTRWTARSAHTMPTFVSPALSSVTTRHRRQRHVWPDASTGPSFCVASLPWTSPSVRGAPARYASSPSSPTRLWSPRSWPTFVCPPSAPPSPPREIRPNDFAKQTPSGQLGANPQFRRPLRRLVLSPHAGRSSGGTPALSDRYPALEPVCQLTSSAQGMPLLPTPRRRPASVLSRKTVLVFLSAVLSGQRPAVSDQL